MYLATNDLSFVVSAHSVQQEYSVEVRNSNVSTPNERYHSLPQMNNLQVQQTESGVCSCVGSYVYTSGLKPESIYISGSDGSLSPGHADHQERLKNLVCNTPTVVSVTVLLECIELISCKAAQS